MAIAAITMMSMYMEIALSDLYEVFIILGGLAAVDKVNAMFEERRLKKAE